MKITRVGIDIGKNVFHLCAVNQAGKVMWRGDAPSLQMVIATIGFTDMCLGD